MHNLPLLIIESSGENQVVRTVTQGKVLDDLPDLGLELPNVTLTRSQTGSVQVQVTGSDGFGDATTLEQYWENMNEDHDW